MKPMPYPWAMIDTDFLFQKLAKHPAALSVAMYAARELQNAGIDGSVVMLRKSDIMKDLKITEKTVERAVNSVMQKAANDPKSFLS